MIFFSRKSSLTFYAESLKNLFNWEEEFLVFRNGAGIDGMVGEIYHFPESKIYVKLFWYLDLIFAILKMETPGTLEFLIVSFVDIVPRYLISSIVMYRSFKSGH
jgi:hypothetical protein